MVDGVDKTLINSFVSLILVALLGHPVIAVLSRRTYVVFVPSRVALPLESVQCSCSVVAICQVFWYLDTPIHDRGEQSSFPYKFYTKDIFPF
jgi:hypothetical protein